MNSNGRCPRCGAEQIGQALNGQCANCLLNLALDSADRPDESSGGFPASVTESGRLRRFGDYELLKEIARGGMGVVYRAHQISLNRPVALKMILAADFSSAARLERFRTEAEAAARLEHPNIVPIYEIGTHEGQGYFSMRFLEGGTLTESMAREDYTPRRAAELIMKVAGAAHYAHQHGILHRDLKPGNILFDDLGHPFVADFGLAKFVEHDSDLTQTLEVLGTPSYMAPEQAAGQTKQISTASDIYSLGAVLYELLTGRAPFRGPTPAATLRQVMETEPERPRMKNRAVDRDLETICLRCLEKDPARRYGSAETLAADLDRWLSQKPILARPSSMPERVVKWARRKPMVAGLIVALHILGIAGLAGILSQTHRANKQARLAIAEAARANIEAANATSQSRRAEDELWNARFSEARALRIAGGSGARVQSAALVQKLIARSDLSEAQRLSLREEAIAQLALVDIRLPTNWVSKTVWTWKPLAWSRTLDRYIEPTSSNRVDLREFPSQRLAASFFGPTNGTLDQALFTSDDQLVAARFKNKGEVHVWRRDTQETILRSMCEGSDLAFHLSVSDNSRTLLMLTDQGVAVQDLARGSDRHLLRPGLAAVTAALSPDSSEIAVAPAARPNIVEIWDSHSGETHLDFRVDFQPHRMAWHPDGTRLVIGGDRGRLEMRTIAKRGAGDFSVSGPFPLSGHQGWIDRMVFAPDGSTLLTYAWDYYCIPWDLTSGRPLLKDPRLSISQINPTGDRLIALREAPISESVATLLQRTGYKTLAWAGEGRHAHGAWISPDGRLGVVSHESTVAQAEGESTLWDFSKSAEIARLKGIWAQFSHDSRTLYTFEARSGNRVHGYDVSVETLANPSSLWNTGKLVYQGHAGEKINTGAIASDGRTLVIAATHSIIFLDTLGERPTRSWGRSAHVVDISNDGKWIATMLHNDLPIVWAAESGQVKLRAEVNSQIRFSSNNKWLAVISRNKLQIYELDSLHPAYSPIIFETAGWTPPFEFSPDSQFFAMAFNRTHIRLYETSTGRELATLSPPNPAPLVGSASLKFSLDGRWLIAARDDGETIGWDLPVVRGELSKLGLNWSLPALNGNMDQASRPNSLNTNLSFNGLFSRTPGVAITAE